MSRLAFEHPRYDEKTRHDDIHAARAEARTDPDVNVVTDISGGEQIRKESYQRIEALRADLIAAVAVQVADRDTAQRRLKQHERAKARYQEELKEEQADLAMRSASMSDRELQHAENRIERLRAQGHVERTEVDRAISDIDRIEPEVKRLVTTAQGKAAEEGRLAEVRLSLYWHEFISHHKDRDRIRWVLQATGNTTPRHFSIFDLPAWVRQAWEDYLR